MEAGRHLARARGSVPCLRPAQYFVLPECSAYQCRRPRLSSASGQCLGSVCQRQGPHPGSAPGQCIWAVPGQCVPVQEAIPGQSVWAFAPGQCAWAGTASGQGALAEHVVEVCPF
eukprot:1157934-Pelagomonas_calceolata.AAC.9